MYCKVKSFAKPAATVITNIFLLAFMEVQMLLKVTLLCEAHAAALVGALKWFVLGMAPQMRKIFAQGRNNPRAAFKVAHKDLGVPL